MCVELLLFHPLPCTSLFWGDDWAIAPFELIYLLNSLSIALNVLVHTKKTYKIIPHKQTEKR